MSPALPPCSQDMYSVLFSLSFFFFFQQSYSCLEDLISVTSCQILFQLPPIKFTDLCTVQSALPPHSPPPLPRRTTTKNQMMPNCFTSLHRSGVFPAEFTLSSTNCSSHRVHLSARLPPVNKPPSSSPTHFFSPFLSVCLSFFFFFLAAKLNFSAITRCNSLPARGTLKCKHNVEDFLSPQSCALSLRARPPRFTPSLPPGFCATTVPVCSLCVSGNRGENHPSRAEHSHKNVFHLQHAVLYLAGGGNVIVF